MESCVRLRRRKTAVRYRQLTTTSMGALVVFSIGAEDQEPLAVAGDHKGLPAARVGDTVGASKRSLGMPASKDGPSVFTSTAK